MQEVVLQSIMFPSADTCTEGELYFRSKNINIGTDVQIVFRQKGYILDTDTYFNGFFTRTWMKYTCIDSLFCNLQLEGRFFVDIYEKSLNDTEIVCKRIKHIEKDSPEKETLRIKIPLKNQELCYFRLIAQSDNAIFYGGFYSTKNDHIRDINIALNLCTYRREDFITRNLNKIQNNIFNKNSQLSKHLYLILVDNGQTLQNTNKYDNLIYIRQRDYGSTGGYTRGMLEAITHKDEWKLSHIILMDDDIVLDTEILERNYVLLRMLKEEYIHYFIGGTMLHCESPYIQQERGGYFDGVMLKSFIPWVDVRDIGVLLQNEAEREKKVNFIGWWYSCIPMTYVRSDNLPYPFFMKWDDVEYGYRNNPGFIHMNGLAVWHMAFEQKYSSANQYFEMRNYLMMIAISQMECSYLQLSKKVIISVCREIYKFRYKDAKLICRAVLDYLKGPEWLKQQESDQLLEEIISFGYKLQSVDTFGKYVENCDLSPEHREYNPEEYLKREEKWKMSEQLGLFFSIFRKGKKFKVLSFDKNPIREYKDAYAVLNYDADSQKGFVVKKDFGQWFSVMLKLLKCLVLLGFKQKRIIQKYDANKQEMENADFWITYLK